VYSSFILDRRQANLRLCVIAFQMPEGGGDEGRQLVG
jgi:hypothetical protein